MSETMARDAAAQLVDSTYGLVDEEHLELPVEVVATPAELVVEARTGVYPKVIKPLLDRLAAALLLLLLLPVLLAVAIAVRLSLGKGVLFRQERIGLHGQRFMVLKFRTMKHSRRTRSVPIDHEDRRKTHKHPADPRLTRVGTFLRKWSLDELPQLINVLRGQMSLVGPRPELTSIVERYEPWQHGRHLVRPGMTGLWQVSDRGGKPMHECVDVDLRYVRSVSFWTDLVILLKTPLSALGRNKGY